MITDAIGIMQAAFEAADPLLWTGQQGDRPGPCKFLAGDDDKKILAGAPPRILFGYINAAVSTAGVPRGGEPGAIARRDVSLLAHIWGATLSQAERMYATWAGASFEALSGYSFAIDSEDWNVGNDVQMKNGDVVHVSFRLSIPLTRLPSKFARVNQASIATKVTT